MNTEDALKFLSEVFLDPVDATAPGWSGQVKLSFFEGGDGEPATATMTIYQGETFLSSSQQPVALLPAGVEVAPERYRAFAEGVRAGLGGQVARYEGMIGPAEFFQVDLLRAPSLRTASDFAHAVADDEAGARALVPLQVKDLAAEHDLPEIADSRTARLLWNVLREQSNAITSAQALAEETRVEAIPLLVVLIERWVERGYVSRGEWFLQGRNGHLTIAQAVEGLLRRADAPALAQRVDALAAAGCFEA